jgi:CDGSH-type Zn-finger protein
MTTPTVAGKVPIPVDVTAGQTYWWCTCGKSANQPFCDGSHKGLLGEK